MDVKVLGTGCQRCRDLYAAASAAIEQAGVDAALAKVEDRDEIRTYRLLATPALVLDGEVKSAGRIPSVEEIAGWLRAAETKA